MYPFEDRYEFLRRALPKSLVGDQREKMVQALAMAYEECTGAQYRYGFIIEPLCMVEFQLPHQQLFPRLLDAGDAIATRTRFNNLVKEFVETIRNKADNYMPTYFTTKDQASRLVMIMSGFASDLEPLGLFPEDATFWDVGAIYINSLMKFSNPTIYDQNGEIIHGGRFPNENNEEKQAQILPFYRKRKLALLM